MRVPVEVHQGKGTLVERLPIEIVERKGQGHPDTLCDMASEELSIALSEYYLENFGRVLHHNVDKCVLVGGQSNARFGGGEILDPIYLMLVGRATRDIEQKGKRFRVPIGRFAVEGTKHWFKKSLRCLDPEKHLIVDYRIHPGSVDLVGTFQEAEDIPRANDTSFGVAFAPLSETERLVYDTERLLNSPAVKKRLPAVGEDIKVMGVRNRDKIGLTVACAMISGEIDDAGDYMDIKKKMEELVLQQAAKKTRRETRVQVNTADNPKGGRYYLTVTGTSAEHGDDGQVGRGNRANGLITPYRPMTLEATAGKNPVSHVGKIYNVTARQILDRLVQEEPSIQQSSCYLVSQIGAPINEPQALNIEVHADGGLRNIAHTAEAIAQDVLEKMPKAWRGFLERRYPLF
ncbi:MAG: methionine adenosyltransferase [Euryarchaeota archaeon]|nr:methionine adenosyltransferase [Euryarchaeota archaeon]